MLFLEQVTSHTLINDHPIQLRKGAKIMCSICNGINEKKIFGGKNCFKIVSPGL